ncbi:MAG: 4Fe-4S binding protein [Thermoplasmata archaeon]|nr:4Fe-4S binding protein [Thermoplasmata archaeon]
MPAFVNEEQCIGCAACVDVCPVEAIKMLDTGKARVDPDTCIECGACVSTCPQGAIEMK